MVQQNVSLTAELFDHAKAMVSTGRYATMSDYMRELIRRDQERERMGAELVALLDEAVASGPPIEMTTEELAGRLHDRITAVTSERNAR